MTPSQDPQIQSQSCTMETCGGRTWVVNFVLPVAAAKSGWVVQEITVDLTYTSGGAGGVGGAGGAGGVGGAGGGGSGGDRHYHFWEAFYVKAGTTGGAYASAFPAGDDTYNETGHSANSAGNVSVVGKAKFYEGTLPVDFVRCNPNATAGSRRATTTKPGFWDGSGTDHILKITWDCTAGQNVSNAQTTPGPDNCP